MTEVHNTDEPDSRTPSAAYLEAPLTTILATLDEDTSNDISTDHLLDSYHTLLLRLRDIAPFPSGRGGTSPALHAWSSTSSAIGYCLQREIRRAYEDVLLLTSQTCTPPPRASGAPSPFNLPQDTLCIAQENAALCQIALRVTAVIFKFSVLHRCFFGELHGILSYK